MNNQVEVKSLLAKLMATENLNVEHKNIPTAYFDLESRTLAVPVWKEMTGDLYDLLMGHEISHALETPMDGWHSATNKRGRNYKSFLNVVEDARIEKKVKTRYPGLRRAFLGGYTTLLKRDFFGIAGQDVNNFSLIDRLNLYAKCGTLVPVKFSPDEQVYVKEMESLSTWHDVLRLTDKLWTKAVEEQEEQCKTNKVFERSIKDEEGEGEEDGQGGGNGQGEGSGENGPGEAGSEEEYGEGAELNEGEPRSLTDESFRRHEHLLSERDVKSFVYANIPTPILEETIIPAKAVNAQLRKYYANAANGANVANGITDLHSYGAERYREFLLKNERYISLLVKEFEMRKAAKSFSKSRLSDTGDLNVAKLARYRIEDLVFKKILRTNKGRSHGLVLLLDKSGSMVPNLKAAIEQLLILTLFCRKVQIPFVVYSFGNANYGHDRDKAFIKNPLDKKIDGVGFVDAVPCFTYKPGDAILGPIFLREMCNSAMPTSEFSDMAKNHLLLAESFSSTHMFLNRPEVESLNSTPLSEALVVVQPLIARFKQTHRLDIVNLIILHDGDDDTHGSIPIMGSKGEKTKTIFLGDTYTCGILRDPRCQFQSSREKPSTLAIALMEWLRFTTGTRIIGFFMNANKRSVSHTYQTKNGQSFNNMPEVARAEILSSLSKNKFVVSYRAGFDAFYLIPGSKALGVEQEELVVVGKITTAKLATAFRRLGQKKLVNRVLVRQFIEQIAV